MQSEFYPFESDDDRLFFKFLSASPQKIIQKAVMISPLPHGSQAFNLALVDVLADGSLCDVSVSNNHDLEKVMGTVAQCISQFFRHHSSAQLYIEGNTPSRIRLYRIVFSRELSEITRNYELYGATGSLIEPFRPGRNYESFLLKLKRDENNH